MVVFKQLNGSLYPQWCREGPTGSVYAATTSGWFDHTTFAQWFESVRTYTYLPTYPYLPVPVRYLGRYLPTYGTRYRTYLSDFRHHDGFSMYRTILNLACCVPDSQSFRRLDPDLHSICGSGFSMLKVGKFLFDNIFIWEPK